MALQTNTPPPAPPAPEAPPPAADAREQVQQATRDALANLSAEIEQDLGRFTGLAKEESDFEDSDEDLEKNDAFNTARNGLRAFFEENRNEAPAHLQKAWRDAAVDFMIAEIQSYSGSLGTMGIRQVEQALAILRDPNQKGKSDKQGIGPFEVWIKKSPHTAEYEKWKVEQGRKAQETKVAVDARTAEEAETKRQADALTAKKQELVGAVSNLETRLKALPQNMIPEALTKQAEALRTKINGDNDGSHLDAYRAEMADLEARIRPYEDPEFRALAENADIPPERKEAILKDVREGRRTPQDAKAQLESARQAALAPPASSDELPVGDKLLAWAESMEDGALKKLMLGVASFFAGLCTTRWIGGWFRGRVMSNRTLAEKFGDPEAGRIVKVEQEFRRFGLPENLVSGLAGRKTKEALALMRQKPTDITKDENQQAKLAKLADAIEAKGGATSDDKLVDFINNGTIWTGIVYPGAALAAAGATAGATAAVPPNTPTVAPGPAQNPPTEPAQATAGAPAGTPGPPEAPPPTVDIEKQRIAAINETLKPYAGRTVDLTTSRVEFQLPYNTNGTIERVRCVIYGNTFEIGAHKYNMELPMGASLKSIAIEGTVESGSATLVAGKFMFSDSREIPLREMLGHLEALRRGPRTHPATIGADTATFTKIA